jgi:hypothetical protein
MSAHPALNNRMLAGEQPGEPLALLGGQARDEVGQGVGGRLVRGIGLAGATSGKARRNS